MTQGLALSKAYFEAVGRPALKQAFPALYPKMAFGLCGEGSDCFGFDDDLSRDHDWGPGFCIWMRDADFKTYGQAVQQVYDDLPKTFSGFTRAETKEGRHRTGIQAITAWFRRYTGLSHPPQSHTEWMRIPLSFLATAVNGEVFEDSSGAFTKRQRYLQNHYPEDLWLWEIACCAAGMAKAGQYNFPRLVHRGDPVTSALILSQFMKAGLTLIYALNRTYPPYSKWLYRGAASLPVLHSTYGLFKKLAAASNPREQIGLIEDICQIAVAELQFEQLSDSSSSFLLDHCGPVLHHVRDPLIQKRPLI
ncbi:DUF4037 domain-containing protein [Pseudoramibacter sp.]|jgi:hypothetical protein|uniref:DUF4037 domain-containing protein n=1 Tax=Pseudoramibacter sp. TaxID=2034862 RepID=UPI0025D47062|nr:DUF4037 domain-containing protein [Pseudoramibacter sp.]MCH4072096.1 DUF4037 domain-containing protein [Pseudoramibacter sp.]MCH4105866.1 DUF4037 domain-containing protein [Pseudoramibacter sp.]